ncbi:MAG: DUF927 domain-containing protein [Erysipelotrichaceae bacterium]|nr:DUF927 domain-containing protein [Erysipelotrichaceae bacterium]
MIEKEWSGTGKGVTTDNTFSHNNVKYMTGPYQVSKDGIYYVTDSSRKLVSHQIILLTAVYSNLETNDQSVDIVYYDTLLDTWKTLNNVSSEIIANKQKLITLSAKGLAVDSTNAGALVRYLSDFKAMNSKIIESKLSVNRFGWVEMNGENLFSPYDNIAFDRANDFMQINKGLTRSKGTIEDWITNIKNIRSEKTSEYVRIMIASALASPLLEILDGLPSYINFSGGTERGKSVCLRLCCSIYGNPKDDGGVMINANATPSSKEVYAGLFHHLPLFIDDYSMKDDSKKRKDDIQNEIYSLTSGRGKPRSNTSLGIRDTLSWKNLIITNVEEPLVNETYSGGAINRVIDIEAPDVILQDPDSVRLLPSEYYGTFGREWVKLMSKEDTRKEVKALWESTFKHLKEIGSNKTTKQMLPMSYILVADILSEKYFFKDGILLDPASVITHLVSKEEVDKYKQLYEYIQGWVDENKNLFPVKQWSIGTNTDGVWVDTGLEKSSIQAYIIEKPADVGFKNYSVLINQNKFNELCARNGRDRKMFVKWLSDHNLLIHDSDRKTKREFVPSNQSKKLDSITGYRIIFKTE